MCLLVGVVSYYKNRRTFVDDFESIQDTGRERLIRTRLIRNST